MLINDFNDFISLYEIDRGSYGVPRKEFYDAFIAWAGKNGYKPPANALTDYSSLRIAFYNAVRERGIPEKLRGAQVCFLIKRKENLDMMNNESSMDILNFIGEDIWTPARGRGGRLDFEVRLLTSKPGSRASQRVTISLKNRALKMVDGYERVYVSSFSKLGLYDKILLKVTKDDKAPHTYALSRKSGENTILIQFTPPREDFEKYEKWNECNFKLRQLSGEVFYIDYADKE